MSTSNQQQDLLVSDDEVDDAQIQEENYYNLQFVVESSPVKLYTSSTKLNSLISKHEARTMHLLNSKGIKYELIFADLQPDQRKQMVDVSRLTDLPQLHIGPTYHGDFVALQELEDRGDLDKIFEGIGLRARPKFMRPGSEMAPTCKLVEAKNGILVATASSKFIRLFWEDSKQKTALSNGSQWMLTMESEPVYIGTDTSYIVNNPTPEPHTFEIRLLPPGASQPSQAVLGQVRIAIPLEDGVLTAKVTLEFVHLSWDDGAHLLNGGNWLLLMNREPVFLGKDTEYVVTTPVSGVHLFSLRLTNANGKDVSDKLKQRLGELIIAAPKPPPAVVPAEEPTREPMARRKTIASVVAMFDQRIPQSDSFQSSNNETPSSSSVLDMIDYQQQIQTEQSVAYVEMLNEKDKQLAKLSRKLEQESQDKSAFEAALGIVRPTSRISSQERNALILARIETLTEFAKGFADAKEGVGQLQQEVEHLREQNFTLMAVELKTRDHKLSELRKELDQAVQRLKTVENTIEKICRQLDLPIDSESRVIHDTLYTLQKERLQFLNRAGAVEREVVNMKQFRKVLETTLEDLTQKLQSKEIDVEFERRKVKVIELERDLLKRQLVAFEESHAVMMRQIETMTIALNDQAERGVLSLALSKVKHSIMGTSTSSNSTPLTQAPAPTQAQDDIPEQMTKIYDKPGRGSTGGGTTRPRSSATRDKDNEKDKDKERDSDSVKDKDKDNSLKPAIKT
eukprot:c12110_g1_i1.p1 GENE.c12110_g1_i1~~c12110_g1_i1.p1  ORF type:complete len:737 (+),score=189.03 c12110_g1_i1:177-2387(+)